MTDDMRVFVRIILQREGIFNYGCQEYLNLLNAVKLADDQSVTRLKTCTNDHLIVVETDLKDIHSVCMKDLIPSHNTAASVFSVRSRRTKSNDCDHYYYTQFLNRVYVEMAIQSIFDNYNLQVNKLFSKFRIDSNTQNDGNTVELCKIIRILSQLFCCLLTIHPFSDGNGRVARILLNICIQSLFNNHDVIRRKYYTIEEDLIPLLVRFRIKLVNQCNNVHVSSLQETNELLNDLFSNGDTSSVEAAIKRMLQL